MYETLRGRKAIIKIIVLTPMTSRIHDHNEIKNTTSMTEAGFYDTQIARINWVSFHLYTYRVQFDLVHVYILFKLFSVCEIKVFIHIIYIQYVL